MDKYEIDEGIKERIIKCVYNHRSSKNATSIEEITATVGVAKGTLYYHFSSKEEIFYNCDSTFLDEISKTTSEYYGEDLIKVNKDNKIECTTYNQQYLGMMKFSLVLKIDIINNYEERFVEFTRGLDKGDDNGFCYYNGIRRVIDLLINQWVFDAADSYYKDTPYLEDLQILSIKETTWT